MRSPGNVKIKIVQFWKLQKKKYKTCNKNKSYKNPSIFKNSKNRKISRGRKKKTYRPTRSPNISWNLNFLLGIRKHEIKRDERGIEEEAEKPLNSLRNKIPRVRTGSGGVSTALSSIFRLDYHSGDRVPRVNAAGRRARAVLSRDTKALLPPVYTRLEGT